MHAIKATVRNGRIETASPLDLPDGTEVVVYPSNENPALAQSDGGFADIDNVGSDDADARDEEDERFWDNSPEGIAAWLREYNSLEPLIFTDEERAAWDKARAEQRTGELAHFDEYVDKIARMWK